MTSNKASPGASRSSVLHARLWKFLLDEFRLDWQGIHGAPHWSRVLHHARYLAARTGAVLRVVELFAVLHDVKRRDDGSDPEHGLRAADFADQLIRSSVIELPTAEQPLLFEALRDHSNGRLDADITVQVCWDADRLDLGRIGICPDVSRLCTAPARDLDYIRRAVEWAMGSGEAPAS